MRYDGARIPDGSHDLSAGANCQHYAYAVLAQFGLHLPPWRSSELWADMQATRRVTDFEPLDLLLFSRKGSPLGRMWRFTRARAGRCISADQWGSR